jgi:hypothetical protein
MALTLGQAYDGVGISICVGHEHRPVRMVVFKPGNVRIVVTQRVSCVINASHCCCALSAEHVVLKVAHCGHLTWAWKWLHCNYDFAKLWGESRKPFRDPKRPS